MKWMEVEVTAIPEWQDVVSQAFMDMGVQGIEIVDPAAFRDVLDKNRYLDYADDGFIESYGDKVIIRSYFHAEQDKQSIENQLSEAFNLYNINPQVIIRLRDDSEWKDNWKKNYKTFHISEKVIIKPSWETCNFSPNQIVIEIDPGMAFGTGTHETTRMCALFLDDLVKGNENVLDLGCGTGILGIVAAKLGASKVTCVDIDEAACRIAKENISNNHASELINVVNGELSDVEKKEYDIVIINIIADVILSLIPDIKMYCKSTSVVLLSGIIKERRQEVLDSAVLHGFRPVQELNDGEWVAMRLCIDS
ncbi:MAG: 50S ribosomal protein L11 methyltransferase [Ruminiclostridium sp.]|nr:50S ribosomal protein L11 methyltransferase [Ruminiclostridium sp.]